MYRAVDVDIDQGVLGVFAESNAENYFLIGVFVPKFFFAEIVFFDGIPVFITVFFDKVPRMKI